VKSATAQLSPEHAALLDVSARLARLEAQVARMSPPEKPLRVGEFAKRVGLSRYAIYERIRRGEIVKRCGRIPAEELGKFGM